MIYLCALCVATQHEVNLWATMVLTEQEQWGSIANEPRLQTSAYHACLHAASNPVTRSSSAYPCVQVDIQMVRMQCARGLFESPVGLRAGRSRPHSMHVVLHAPPVVDAREVERGSLWPVRQFG